MLTTKLDSNFSLSQVNCLAAHTENHTHAQDHHKSIQHTLCNTGDVHREVNQLQRYHLTCVSQALTIVCIVFIAPTHHYTGCILQPISQSVTAMVFIGKQVDTTWRKGWHELMWIEYQGTTQPGLAGQAGKGREGGGWAAHMLLTFLQAQEPVCLAARFHIQTSKLPCIRECLEITATLSMQFAEDK